MSYGVSKYKVGDKVKHALHREGVVMDIRDYAPDFHYKVCRTDNRGFWCPESELTPIPSTLTSEEMIKALTENPEIKAKGIGDYGYDSIVIMPVHGVLCWEAADKKAVVITRRFMDAKWTLIYPDEPKPVDFMDAANSGKRIKPDNVKYACFQELADVFRSLELTSYELAKELINGKWLIEEESK